MDPLGKGLAVNLGEASYEVFDYRGSWGVGAYRGVELRGMQDLWV